MRIEKITINNFKFFKEKFSLKLSDGANILVGNNEAGKSTILEAIHLALTGSINGKYLKNELSQHLFNNIAVEEYILSHGTETPLPPPSIAIEIYFSQDASLALLEGNGNNDGISASGINYRIEFDGQYQSEYEELIKTHKIKTIPIEYYKVTRLSFARDAITTRSIPMKSALIDSSNIRLQNGADAYISRIIKDNLEDKERVQISQAHRQMKDNFMLTPSVQEINKKITDNANITRKSVRISVDLSTQNAWESSLITYLDDVPLHYVGKGEQSVVKTNLALSHKKSQEANVILLEEPENHLSYSKLNELISQIVPSLAEKQLIISTHSSFVANKLGLEKIIFLHDSKTISLNELSLDTKVFFKKLPGYDTLRLILCKKAILVEGPSDELVVQKAYMSLNQGKLPIQNGIDVISVGTSFLRFLEIAKKINKNVAVITDNDGDIDALENKYKDYIGENSQVNIKIFYDKIVDKPESMDFNYNTLEPKLLKANNKEILNKIFAKEYATNEELLKYMRSEKTACAVDIFDTEEAINFPEYILAAVKSDNGQ